MYIVCLEVYESCIEFLVSWMILKWVFYKVIY